jgi:Zn-dependent oligopeptidase
MNQHKALLEELNNTMCKLHKAYENAFWVSYMGDHTVDKEKDSAKAELDSFRSNRDLSSRVTQSLKTAKGEIGERLQQWSQFFAHYQVPKELLELKGKIVAIETEIEKTRANCEEGYIDPKTDKFVKMSSGQMSMVKITNKNESIRKACFDAIEALSVLNVDSLIELVNLRNKYAQALGYEDFYAYKLDIEEGMTKKQLFDLCDEIYNRTKYGFENLREMEKEKPGLRLPWNTGFMLAGDLVKKKDPYLQFTSSVERWGKSFAALGITFKGAKLQLDLLDREGKYNNGFCHWPSLVHFENEHRIPGECNFTSNAVLGQIGAGNEAIQTLFHEGGHAAHLTNVETSQVCMNHEYPPTSTAWAETQSMFLDSMQSSIEWLTRYAKNANGESFPFSIFEESVRRLSPISPLGFMGILAVIDFERELYSTPNLTKKSVIEISSRVNMKHSDRSQSSVSLLFVPHIYSWESACSYQGYGLATLALTQWREYFFEKYGYIVDNPAVGQEMRQVWELGASKTFPEFVRLATGKELSAEPYIKTITRSADETLKIGIGRISRLKSVPSYEKPIELDANISMVHGKIVVSDNVKSFEDMEQRYRNWVLSQETVKKSV